MKEKRQRAQTEAPERPQSLISSLLRVTGDRERGRRGPEPARGARRRPDDKERLRGSPGEGAPEQAETEEGEAQKEAPERSRSRLGLVFQ